MTHNATSGGSSIIPSSSLWCLQPHSLGHIKGCFLRKLMKSKIECPNEDIYTYHHLFLYLNLEFPSQTLISFCRTVSKTEEFFSFRVRMPDAARVGHSTVEKADRNHLTCRYIMLGLFFNWLSKFIIQAISHQRPLFFF